MRKLSTKFFQVVASVLFFVLIVCIPKGYSAFIPAENSKEAIHAQSLENPYLTIALMSNKEIESLMGKKLTLKEKLGLYFLRKEIRKNNKRNLRKVVSLDDECFTMYLKSGDILEVKLIQITPNEIKYQRCNKPGDPEIVIAKSDVFSIKDKSGDLIYSSKNESWKKGYGARTGPTDNLALVSGILGIASLTIGLLVWPLGLAAGLVAFILGLSALRRFRSNNEIRGEGWAITGVTAGGLWIFFGILILIALAAGW
jgi:hypothetical protein